MICHPKSAQPVTEIDEDDDDDDSKSGSQVSQNLRMLRKREAMMAAKAAEAREKTAGPCSADPCSGSIVSARKHTRELQLSVVSVIHRF